MDFRGTDPSNQGTETGVGFQEAKHFAMLNGESKQCLWQILSDLSDIKKSNVWKIAVGSIGPGLVTCTFVVEGCRSRWVLLSIYPMDNS